MSRYQIVVCLTVLWLWVHPSYGQVDVSLDQLRTVVPPSPNVSSLGKFGEWPVSLYTGIPSINIPIYTLKSRNLNVPISLDYHAAGIRVGEIASWVGLGWALNAGGCISRTVRGLPDDESYFTTAFNFSDANNFCSSPITESTYFQDVAAAANGNVDVEQDVYNLNVLGRSYRIYIRADSTAYTMPASNIKITSNYLGTGSNQSWTVILEDGTKLLFGGPYSATNPYTELTSNVNFGTEDQGDDYISAWYLQSMTAPTGETITFTYSQSNITQDTHFTQSDNLTYWYTSIVAGSENDPPFKPYNTISSKVSLQTVNQLSLSTIQSDQATVYFIPTDSNRTDLPGGEALSEIKVYSKLTNSYVGDWTFNYAYSTCASGNELVIGSGPAQSYYHYRLKLMSLSHNAMDNSQPEVWSFTYNPLSLPSRRSYAQDYWGFYNGARANNSLLVSVPFNPTVCPLVVDNYSPWTFTTTGFTNSLGDNHTPNEQYMQAEMLTNITYPTGGSTAFNYEGNSMVTSQELFVDTTAPLNINAVGGESPVVDTVNFSFVLTKPEYVYLNLTSTISPAILSDFPGAKVFGQILDNEGNVVASITGNGGGWYNIYQAGTYTLHLYSNCNQGEFSDSTTSITAAATLQYYPSHGFQNLKQQLGGARINNIQSYDSISSTPILSKYYVYDSAFVINPVDTVNSYITIQGDVLPANPDGSQYEYMKVTRNCATKFSLGSIQGGTVGYGKVTTYDGLNGVNGYTVSSFSCDPQTQAGLAASLVFPYPPNDQYEWRNGLLLSEITYTSTGQQVKANKNSYNFIQRSRVENFGDGFSTINAPTTCAGGGDYGACGTTTVCYSNTNEQVEHASTTLIDYDVSTGNAISTATTYYYDDTLNMQPTRTVSLDSKGDTVLIDSRSPFEISAINSSVPLTGPATAALDTMISRNIVGQPVETEQYVGGVLSYKALTNYQVQTTGLVLPGNIMLQNLSNPIETRVNFLEYDNYGNLLEQAKSSDVNHNYIYDYKGNYPIAEVINGDSTSIAYTSFEADGTGNWILGSGSVDTTTGITGIKSYNLTGTITRTGLNSANTYLVSYWTNNNSPFSISGTISGYPVQGKTEFINNNSWTLFVHKVTGQSTITVSGSGHIDELRLYPSTAQMTTYTYAPLIGMTSKADVGNRVTYYEYDGLNRLKRVRDQDYNILKTFNYQYQVPAGCGSGCTILSMKTLAGTNTISYPVGVFDIHGALVGNATNQAAYDSLWNSDTADARIGTLAAGIDSMHFNLTLNAGQTPPAAVSGCRFLQYDLAYNLLDGILPNSGTYVNFGDGTGMRLPQSPTDTPKILAPNTTFYESYIIHNYPDSSPKTITIYHNDSAEIFGLDNANSPALSLTHISNFRGNVPQNAFYAKFSSIQSGTALTMANIANWNSIHSLTSFNLFAGDGGPDPCEHVSYAQDFMAGNAGLQELWTSGGGYYLSGVRDTTFKISLLKSNWNTYFTQLQQLYISDAHWNREDLSHLTNLQYFVIAADNVLHSNNPSGNSPIQIPSPVLDTMLNQIAAGAGQTVSNGVIAMATGGTNRTSASDAAVTLLQSKGWLISIYW